MAEIVIFPTVPIVRVGSGICARHCSVCEGQDHHWMPACDEATGEPMMVCKHCDASRDIADDEELI